MRPSESSFLSLAPGPGNPGRFRGVLFGSGCVDFVAAFRALATLGYRGCFLVEMWAGSSPDPVADCAAAREWILARMVAAGIA